MLERTDELSSRKATENRSKDAPKGKKRKAAET
jgi:hypothetical protein